MIKIFSENEIKKEFLDNLYSKNEDPSKESDNWDYSIKELDYLLDTHSNECFILYKNRLYECDEIEVLRNRVFNSKNKSIIEKDSLDYLKVPIKAWYISEYPDDSVGMTLSPSVTFYDLNNLLNSGKGDVYSLLGGNADTIVRERCFKRLCDLTNQSYDEVYYKWVTNDYTPKFLYEINLKEFRINYESSDFAMLKYIENYITPNLKSLYDEVLDYNEIFANGWTIKSLFKMDEDYPYWKNKAENFIKKYNIPKTDYNKYKKYFNKYCELRDNLLDSLGLLRYTESQLSVDEIPQHGFLDGDIVTSIEDIEKDESYTVARIMNFGNCVELHYYPDRKPEIEYGYKYSNDYWESEIDSADWFNLNMTDEDVSKKMYQLFKDKFGIEKENLIEDMEMEI